MPERCRVTFTSEFARYPDSRWGETEENITTNQCFPIDFVLPLSGDGSQREKHVVMMINGFAEANADLYNHPEVGLSSLLAQRDFASVLLPIPFHLHRIPHTRRYERSAQILTKSLKREITVASAAPTVAVMSHQERLYLGYRQLVDDINQLVSRILPRGDQKKLSEEPHEFREWFDEETKVHLLGYSLGGLAALATFLRDRTLAATNGGRPYFSTCTLLCAGSTFMDLVPTELQFKRKDWDALRDFYYSRSFETRKAEIEKELAEGLPEIPPNRRELVKASYEMRLKRLRRIVVDESLYFRYFERAILGVPLVSQDLHKNSHLIYTILGTDDRVVPPETLFGMHPSEREFAVLHVPALEHRFVESDVWMQWSSYVVDSIVTFLTKHPGPSSHED